MARTVTRPQKLVSTTAGAAYADVSTRTIYRWIADGHLRAYRVGPRLLKIDLMDLERLVRSGLTCGPKIGVFMLYSRSALGEHWK